MKTSNLRMYQNRSFIGEQPITEEQVRAAIRQYDREYTVNDYPRTDVRSRVKTWFENQQYNFALRYDGKCYPPKYILRLAIAPDHPDDVDVFYGGGQQGNANWVLEKLGYEIIPKSECV